MKLYLHVDQLGIDRVDIAGTIHYLDFLCFRGILSYTYYMSNSSMLGVEELRSSVMRSEGEPIIWRYQP